MNLEKILHVLMQEVSRPDYLRQFENIKCDDQYYYLYKHLSFDPKLQVLNLFKKLQLKFTHPDNFNDPYDCMASIEFNNAPNDVKEILHQHFSTAIKAKLSVTCFNNNPLNMLMWSHYAQSHKGFLVEFKIPHPNPKAMVHEVFNVQAVKYQNEFPKIPLDISNPLAMFDVANGAKLLDFVANQYLIKSKDWSYENEFRTLAHDYDSSNFNSLLKEIPATYISSVILGAKLTNHDPNKMALIESINYFNKYYQQDIKVYEAVLKPNSFKITVPNHPILDKNTKTLAAFLSN